MSIKKSAFIIYIWLVRNINFITFICLLLVVLSWTSILLLLNIWFNSFTSKGTFIYWLLFLYFFYFFITSICFYLSTSMCLLLFVYLYLFTSMWILLCVYFYLFTSICLLLCVYFYLFTSICLFLFVYLYLFTSIYFLLFVYFYMFRFNDDYEYPAGVQAVGWIFELLPTAITVGYFFFSLYK